MTPPPVAGWRLILRSYPCPTCHAHPGDPCTTHTGNPTLEHAARQQATDRCPKCGEMQPADTPPATLCPRCQLLRQLNTERATTWKRRT
jgi:hypothetical protein